MTDAEIWAAEGLYQGDCREVLRDLADQSIDCLITDPPYGIGYMGKEWDRFAPAAVRSAAEMKQRKDPSLIENRNVRGRQRSPAQTPSGIEYDRSIVGQRQFQDWTAEWAAEVYRVLKPGAHGVICGAPRSFHRMACGLEDAGFEIRDCLNWLFGSGFPKSKNLGNGYGTALKPGWEPIVLVRKPLGGLTTTAAFELYGTGALAIDDCRLTNGSEDPRDAGGLGRWPGNVILDPDAAADLDLAMGQRTSGANPSRRNSDKFRNPYSPFAGQADCTPARGADTGGVSRYFYCPKVSQRERDFGLDHLPIVGAGDMTGGREVGSAGLNNPRAGAGRGTGSRNAHPTVKPLALMRWLVKLICPPGGIVLDPFVGSGSTGIAAALEDRGFFATDLEAQWLMIAAARIRAWREAA